MIKTYSSLLYSTLERIVTTDVVSRTYKHFIMYRSRYYRASLQITANSQNSTNKYTFKTTTTDSELCLVGTHEILTTYFRLTTSTHGQTTTAYEYKHLHFCISPRVDTTSMCMCVKRVHVQCWRETQNIKLC